MSRRAPTRSAALLGAATLLLGCPTARPGERTQSATSIAFVDVTVVPMDREQVLPHYTVLVDSGRIVGVGPGARLRVPNGATVIDGRGKYLMPGLADLHVHLVGPPDLQHAILRLFVVNGVTTLLNMRGAPEHLALRADVAKGAVIGPTVYTVGPYVNQPFVTTPDEVERAVVEQKQAGYDFVKMHGDLTREAYARLNAVGRREGIRIIGHAPRTLGIEAMFEQRQYAVVHAEEYLYDRTHSSRDFAALEPRIPELAGATRKAGTWVMPNLTAFKTIGLMANDLDAILARPEMRFLPSPIRDGWGPATNPYTRRFGKDHYPGIMERYQMLERFVLGFRDAGVPMLIGTDALNTGVVPGFSTHDELANLVLAGLTPYEALRAATANAAEFLGVSDQVGTVTARKRADLILLDANPLENVANARRLAGVMLHGRWLPDAQLRQMLDSLAKL